ncbi:MAG: hypothetical protein WCA16_09265, partial [Candidatus Sulfotelmatobacter sp.]
MLASKRAEVGSIFVCKTGVVAFGCPGEPGAGDSERSAMGKEKERGLFTVYQPGESAQTAYS